MKVLTRNPMGSSDCPPLPAPGPWFLALLGGAATALLLRSATPTLPLPELLGPVPWMGWALAQVHLQRRRLARAERLWSMDRPSGEILAEISRGRLAGGEAGYRLRLLASRVRLGEGDRRGARRESLLAHLHRLPFWERLPIRAYFLLANRLGPGRAEAWEERLHRLAPAMAPLAHRIASREIATEVPSRERIGWERMLAALPAAQDDPLLLESMMSCALERIQGAPRLGHQEWSPLVPYLFEEALSLLLGRHGEPRVAWDRTAPALYLLQQGRPREVLRLAQGLPLARRSAALCEAEIVALRQTGDLRGAQAAIRAALEVHAGSFRLWMERFHAAMAASETGIALDSLEMAERLLPGQPEADRERHSAEWHLRRAEFAHWIEGDPERAWPHLQALPEGLRDENGLLLLRVQIALGQHEAAFEASRRLLARQPHSAELLLLQAECMAGMETWEALPPFLEQMPEEGRKQPVFWHLKGLAQAHLGSPLEAREALEIAVHMAPRDLSMVLDAGHASMELGDYARAEHHWRCALQLDPKCEEALLQLADTRQALQDPEGARRLLRECLLHHPESEGAQAFLTELEAN